MFDMVRPCLFAGFIFAATGTMLSAQSGQTPSLPPPAGKAITLTGCVQLDPAKPEWLTVSDTKTGITYRLTGATMKAYIWRNVRIVGGLVPSPNIAAQAGAIDPTKAAMAYQGAARPGLAILPPPEFNVTRVRQLTGSCAPQVER